MNINTHTHWHHAFLNVIAGMVSIWPTPSRRYQPLTGGGFERDKMVMAKDFANVSRDLRRSLKKYEQTSRVTR